MARALARRECPTGAEGSYADALQRIIEMLRAAAKTAKVQISGELESIHRTRLSANRRIR